MQTLASMRSYKIVLASFLSYLPSRILVILNSLIIVPILAYFLTSSEMSIFQISIGILNFVCTCSTDWIAKSVLRFYRRYHNENRLNEFYSNIAMLEFRFLVNRNDQPKPIMLEITAINNKFNIVCSFIVISYFWRNI